MIKMFEPYEKIYNDCMNKSLTIPKYEPVKEYLYRILDYYTNKGIFNYSFGMPKTIPASFTKQLIDTFDVLISHDAIDNLNEIITFIFETKLSWTRFFSFLLAIKLKNDMPDRKEYYSAINDLIWSLRTVDLTHFDTNIRIENIVKIYAKYYKNSYEPNISEDEKANREYYSIVGTILCANFYLTDLDLDYLDLLFSKVSLNGTAEYFRKYEQVFGNFINPIIIEEKKVIEETLLNDISEINEIKKKIK